MRVHETPGVYFERLDANAPRIRSLRTDIAGFVGLAVRGPLDTPVPVESYRQFASHFGGFTGQAYLAYVVRAFFENGGRRCWIVRVASQVPERGAATASVDLPAGGAPRWRIAASSPGAWGNRLGVTLSPGRVSQTLGDPAASTATYTTVASTAGFERATLARLSQADGAGGLVERVRVVALADPITRRLYWVHPEAGRGLPYDRPLAGFDPSRPISIESVAYTLTVREGGALTALFVDLSLVPEHPRYAPLIAAQPDYDAVLAVRDALPLAPPPVIVERIGESGAGIPQPLDAAPATPLSLAGGRDGLATLAAEDFLGWDVPPLADEAARNVATRGLRALERVSEVAIVAVPDILVRPVAPPVYAPPSLPTRDPCAPCGRPDEPAPFSAPTPVELPPVFPEEEIFRVQAGLVERCELLRDRFAVLDLPFDRARDDAVGLAPMRAWRERFDSAFAALYGPWLSVVDPLGLALTRVLPACGHVIGQYAATDIRVGVHAAAANTALAWAQGLSMAIDDASHGLLNTLGVNVLRAEPGRGIRAQGARTVASDPAARFVNVRRLILMVMKALDLATQWAVFEPNDATTRAALQLAVGTFLEDLWRAGAFVGDSAEAAFVVRCDEDNNPPADRDLGRLILDIAVAPVKPFEFVVLRVGRVGAELEIIERPASLSGGGA